MADKLRLVGAGNPNPVVRLEMTGTMATQFVGHAVDLTGLTFKAVHLNGSKETVTSKVKTSREKWGATEGTQKVDIGYDNKKITLSVSVEAVELSSITVKTPPTKTAYKVGETIDMTGLVIKANFNDGTSEDVTEGYTFVPDTMASDTAKVTISYTESGVTKTTTQAVILKAI